MSDTKRGRPRSTSLDFFQSEVGFRRNDKVLDFAEMLAEHTAIPIKFIPHVLSNLWEWVADKYPDGCIGDATPARIKRATDWDGDAQILYDALLELRFLEQDEDGQLHVHDWEHFTGKARAKQDYDRNYQAERYRKSKESKTEEPIIESTDQNSRNENEREQTIIVDSRNETERDSLILVPKSKSKSESERKSKNREEEQEQCARGAVGVALGPPPGFAQGPPTLDAVLDKLPDKPELDSSDLEEICSGVGWRAVGASPQKTQGHVRRTVPIKREEFVTAATEAFAASDSPNLGFVLGIVARQRREASRPPAQARTGPQRFVPAAKPAALEGL